MLDSLKKKKKRFRFGHETHPETRGPLWGLVGCWSDKVTSEMSEEPSWSSSRSGEDHGRIRPGRSAGERTCFGDIPGHSLGTQTHTPLHWFTMWMPDMLMLVGRSQLALANHVKIIQFNNLWTKTQDLEIFFFFLIIWISFTFSSLLFTVTVWRHIHGRASAWETHTHYTHVNIWDLLCSTFFVYLAGGYNWSQTRGETFLH